MQQKRQSGRSMIEMLGVLAVIGILSAGGIAGYSSAMESYKVNKTIEMITFVAARNEMLFAKRTEGTTYVWIMASSLCDLKLLPDEICRTCGEDDVCKGYFGEKIRPGSWLEHTNRPGTDLVNTPEGKITILRPVTAFGSYFYYPVPTSACAKLLSSKAWENVTEIATVSQLGNNESWYELPLSPSEAAAKCQEETAKKSGFFNLVIFTSVKDFIAE